MSGYYEPRTDGLGYYAPRTDGLIRVFASAKVDHLSRTDRPWAPICGQRLKRVGAQWALAHSPYPGTHLCRRCESEAAT